MEDLWGFLALCFFNFMGVFWLLDHSILQAVLDYLATNKEHDDGASLTLPFALVKELLEYPDLIHVH